MRISIIQNVISKIEKIKPETREVNLNADRKRMWFKDLKDVNDRIKIDSIPISMNFFNKV